MAQYQFDAPRIWADAATIALLVALAIHAVRYPHVPAAKAFAAACVFLLLCVLGTTLETAATEPGSRFFWYTFQAVWQLPSATATTCFVLEYVWPGRWLNRRNLLLLSIPCLIALLFMSFDQRLGLIWPDLQIGGPVDEQYGPLAWLLLGYGWSLILVNMGAFAWLFAHSRRHRMPVTFLMLGQIFSRAAFLAQFLAPALLPRPIANTLAIAGLSILNAVALFGFRILDPRPAAFATATAQMHEGMVVFSPDWRVLDANAAAAKALRISAPHARGQKWSAVLPALAPPELEGAASQTLELRLGDGSEARDYAVDVTSLIDQRGFCEGYLLLLRDTTEQCRMQARALELQWVQAIIEEREQLAHELHDGLSQDLAFLNVQAQAAQIYADNGQVEAARVSLDRLAQVARDLQGDTRELIGNLLAVSLPSENFYTALCHVLSRFQEQTDLAVSVEMDSPPNEICGPAVLPATTAVQLLRIAQEALANVRKHAGTPSRVSVGLAAEHGQLILRISDNGAGFDPSLNLDDRKHFGLQVMQRRAERFGGQLVVQSAPGEGTTVSVCAPLRPGATDAALSAAPPLALSG